MEKERNNIVCRERGLNSTSHVLCSLGPVFCSHLNSVQISEGECVEQGRLPGSGRAHDGQDLAGLAVSTRCDEEL